MPDKAFVILFTGLLLLFAGLGLVLLLRPSEYLGRVNNQWQPDTPQNRVQMRGVGLYLCIVILMMSSGAFPAFQHKILIALVIAPILIPIILWLLSKFSALQQVMREHVIDPSVEDRAWEWRMTLLLGGLLCAIVLIAVLA